MRKKILVLSFALLFLILILPLTILKTAVIDFMIANHFANYVTTLSLPEFDVGYAQNQYENGVVFSTGGGISWQQEAPKKRFSTSFVHDSLPQTVEFEVSPGQVSNKNPNAFVECEMNTSCKIRVYKDLEIDVYEPSGIFKLLGDYVSVVNEQRVQLHNQ